MPRAKTRVASRDRRKKILKSNSGFFGKKNNCIRIAQDAFWHSGVYAYTGRKRKKRDFRSLWILRINAGARSNGTTYAKLICGLKSKNIELNRKTLAYLATSEPAVFSKVVSSALA